MKISDLKNDWRIAIRKLLADHSQIYTFREIVGLMTSIESNRNKIGKWLLSNTTRIKFENITYYGSSQATAAAKKIWGLK